MSANAYSFLPWLRTGLTTRIKGDVAGPRATIPIGLRLTGDAIEDGKPALNREFTQPVQLYGPGDVVGVDPRAVSRTEPKPGITNFEPNYLAHIEFYDEDFPWRYSPAKPDETKKRLAPWLALVVLSETPVEFEDGRVPEKPLPFITVKNPQALQPPGELGAWAHVHVNGELDGRIAVDGEDMARTLENLNRVLREAPDSACSRVLCPRHLKPSTTYHAFLVPAFEAGRLAGLGEAVPETLSATKPSWGSGTGDVVLPYYHRWSFTTSTVGDFEFLVRLLKPYEADNPVGRRDMDAHRRIYGLPPLTTPTTPDGVLKLGGALQLPDTDDHPDAYENWDGYHTKPVSPYPNQWQRAMAGFVNLAGAYRQKPPQAANAEAAGAGVSAMEEEPDPVITPPLYGCWPALTQTLLTENGQPVPPEQLRNWVHRLNLDPRHRVAAQFGTKVVQARQEEFMAAAWNQLGDIQRANALIRAAQLGRQVGNALHGKHVEPYAPKTAAVGDQPVPSKALTLTAPAHGRVLERATTAFARTAAGAGDPELLAVGYKVDRSRVAAAPMSAPMRRITRPGSRLRKRLLSDGNQFDLLVDRIDRKEVFAARPKVAPPVTTASLGLAPRAAAADPVDETLGVIETIDDMLDGLRAEKTVLENLAASMDLPERLRLAIGKNLVEILAYPVFDMPMYEELLKFSVETFVPNIGLLPENSITLLENNRQFIESYLIGLNHEMAREMLWREFPTDQRGTPFRQFWDPRPVPLEPGESREAWRERLYDIPPLHRWAKTAKLGENNHRRLPPEPGKNQKKDLVLVIRGELLKKYPNVSIYAHKAVWPRKKDGTPDTSGERTIAPIPANVPLSDELVRLPVYEAKVSPDLYLLGFPLSEDEARSGGADKLGWFFVLKERPGDPRFGLDEPPPGPLPEVEVWNDATWGHLDPGNPGSGFVRFDRGVVVHLDEFLEKEDQEKIRQRQDDEFITEWAPGVSAADVAYILFQAPVLVAVHAQEMLRDA
ncbi:hypothetical protein [Amycolatopsis alba]|uniref:Uncharacterized protein n=1 Tax=Amycolatopsis alba DSM 44262 TaxID=1125972 RepID=A0A229RUQ7_AMYAL|nr:hypothetical protein [Amycolatopsis alba]OXM50376.1 hypothetical protein CFP75_16670 [Amycolatopsis alba DSM 44262]